VTLPSRSARGPVSSGLLLGVRARLRIDEASARRANSHLLLKASRHRWARCVAASAHTVVDRCHPVLLAATGGRVARTEARAGRAPVDGRRGSCRRHDDRCRCRLPGVALHRGHAVPDRDRGAPRLTRGERTSTPSNKQHHRHRDRFHVATLIQVAIGVCNCVPLPRCEIGRSAIARDCSGILGGSRG
jgi:hypothetical protein